MSVAEKRNIVYYRDTRMNSNQHCYLHALRSIPDIGNSTIRHLLQHFGSSEAAWHAPESALYDLSSLRSAKTKERIIAGRKQINPAQEWTVFLETGLTLMTPDDEGYPELLRELPDRPETLYVEGTLDWLRPVPMIAIVGSRKFTAYGEQVAGKLAEDLTHAGFLVVSGLAFGIDSVSHEAALTAGGETIAVLGSGLRRISPASHIPLAQKIAQHGALVSEYPPAMSGNIWTFPERNRIIAGMTLGTIVIEAAEGSGSLITAACALDYNREVFAVPGSILSHYSIGTNALIKRGAKLVMGVQDILEELPLATTLSTDSVRPIPPTHSLAPEEQTLLDLLTHEPLHVDRIIKQTGLGTALVSSLLSQLELKGLAKNVGGMHYVRM